MIRQTQVVLTAAGSDGSATATGNTNEVVSGCIKAVHISYGENTATADVTIVEANKVPAMPVLTVSNNGTDGWYYPQAATVNQAGAAITDGGVDIVTNDHLEVSVAQANDTEVITVTITWEV